MKIVPFGYCQCGCGRPAPIAKWTRANRGWVKGQPKRYIAGHSPPPVVSKEQARAAAAKGLAVMHRRRREIAAERLRRRRDTVAVSDSTALYRAEKAKRAKADRSAHRALMQEAKREFVRWQKEQEISRRGGRPRTKGRAA